MRKEEIIKRYGEAAYKKQLDKAKEWARKNPERMWKVRNPDKALEVHRQWRAANPERVKANSRKADSKGGKYYEYMMGYQTTGIPGERHSIRAKHGYQYRSYKQIIAPESQIHHEWIPNTANYSGVALVEKDQHIHGYIDVIQILEGEITLSREAEISGAHCEW